MGLIPSRWPGLVVNEDRVTADEGGLLDAYANDVYGIRAMTGIEYAIDVGAHIGGATALIHECFPEAVIVAVEACPENIPALDANVESFAYVRHAAVTYEQGPMYLASTVYEGCRTSGSSVVIRREQWESGMQFTWDPTDYHFDDRRLVKHSIESLMGAFPTTGIDLLKLDCEGSEISILLNCTCLDKIGTIVGEYHDEERFLEVVPRGFTLEIWDGHLFRMTRS